MTDKKELIHSTDAVSRGDVESVQGKGDASGTNNPDSHFDVHTNKRKYYDIEKSPQPEDVFRWQREHIKIKDQDKAGYPLNVIIDPAMREMYQHVHEQGLTNVFDRWASRKLSAAASVSKDFLVSCALRVHAGLVQRYHEELAELMLM